MITTRYLSVFLLAIVTLQPALASPLRFTPSAGIKTGAIKGSAGVAYTLLNGKQAEVLKLYAQAPVGTIVSASLLKVNRVNARTLLLINRGKNFSKLEFTETGKTTATIGSSAQAATTMVPVAAAETAPADSIPPTGSICDGLSDVMIDIMIKQASQQFRRTITREEFCRPPSQNVPPSSGGSGGTSNSSTGLADRYLTIFVPKDTCATTAKTQYIVRVQYTFPRKRVQRMAAENQIFAAAAERSIYTGRTSSALKPVSEGKFAPHPLFLMQAIRPFLIGNERIFVRTWNKQGGFSTKAELPVSRWVPYRGMILSTVVASSALGSGAPASVELYDGNFSGYSVCMRLRRTRQNVNGYPNVQAKDEAF